MYFCWVRAPTLDLGYWYRRTAAGKVLSLRGVCVPFTILNVCVVETWAIEQTISIGGFLSARVLGLERDQGLESRLIRYGPKQVILLAIPHIQACCFGYPVIPDVVSP